jgi:putative hydrolase of the HAD superfamily
VTRYQAVLFDFGDTLFERTGEPDVVVETAAALGTTVAREAARRTWEAIQAAARSPEEIARGRDLSAERHRREWTRLYSAADVLAPGLGRALYEREIDPARWSPFADTLEVLTRLGRAGLRIGVVSDTGWDVRSVFAAHGCDRLIGTFVLSFERGAAKPTPRLFADACAELGVAPERTLMVGDNPVTDGGATAAGLVTLILPAARPAERRGLDLVLRLAGRRRGPAAPAGGPR